MAPQPQAAGSTIELADTDVSVVSPEETSWIVETEVDTETRSGPQVESSDGETELNWLDFNGNEGDEDSN